MPELPPHYHTSKDLPPHLMSTLKKAFDMASPSFANSLKNPSRTCFYESSSHGPAAASSLNIPAVLVSLHLDKKPGNALDSANGIKDHGQLPMQLDQPVNAKLAELTGVDVEPLIGMVVLRASWVDLAPKRAPRKMATCWRHHTMLTHTMCPRAHSTHELCIAVDGTSQVGQRRFTGEVPYAKTELSSNSLSLMQLAMARASHLAFAIQENPTFKSLPKSSQEINKCISMDEDHVPYQVLAQTKESYDRWVTRRLWGFRQQISKAKYLRMSVGNIRKLQENTVALYTERKTLLGPLSRMTRSAQGYPDQLHLDFPRGHATRSPIRIPSAHVPPPSDGVSGRTVRTSLPWIPKNSPQSRIALVIKKL
ncbi:hypothetical protein CK203_111646 [Vitis vinifera]|uniref:Uncharacterized protein n=1 Tax=Vitis vinifera TaxID=29760 RepID=A0A438CB91_VITVI|nr:hypothetical protein CK203_111646 [Vitis vinifera]